MAKEPSFRDYMLQLQEKNAMLQKQLKEEEKKHEEIAKKYDALESKIKRRKAIIQMIVVQLVNYLATSNRASKGFALRTFPVLPDCQLCARQDDIPSVVPTVLSFVIIYLLCAVYSDCFISDIDCCVLITIVMCYTMWTDPFSYRQILCL